MSKVSKLPLGKQQVKKNPELWHLYKHICEVFSILRTVLCSFQDFFVLRQVSHCHWMGLEGIAGDVIDCQRGCYAKVKDSYLLHWDKWNSALKPTCLLSSNRNNFESNIPFIWATSVGIAPYLKGHKCFWVLLPVKLHAFAYQGIFTLKKMSLPRLLWRQFMVVKDYYHVNIFFGQMVSISSAMCCSIAFTNHKHSSKIYALLMIYFFY